MQGLLTEMPSSATRLANLDDAASGPYPEIAVFLNVDAYRWAAVLDASTTTLEDPD